jgi:hypothetical protein
MTMRWSLGRLERIMKLVGCRTGKKILTNQQRVGHSSDFDAHRCRFDGLMLAKAKAFATIA